MSVQYTLLQAPHMTSQQDAIKGLLAFLPLLQNTSIEYARIGYWGDMNSRVSTTTARDLFQYLHNNGFVLENFNWEAWSNEAVSFMDDRQKLTTADLDTLYKVITAHMRADHFLEGHYDSIIENGFLAAILSRMKEITQTSK